jgi:hypothetical protein
MGPFQEWKREIFNQIATTVSFSKVSNRLKKKRKDKFKRMHYLKHMGNGEVEINLF